MILAGIDYSMTSPCICVGPFNPTFEFKNLRFFFLTGKDKFTGKWLNGQIYGKLHTHYNTAEQRFNNIATWAINVVNGAEFVVLEGYAMGAKGLVFHIGENTGLLKHQLWRFQKTFITPSPPTIKKFATGKGNAKKEQMYESFLAETKIDLMTELSMTRTDSPLSDIVDSYYMVKYAWQQQKDIQTAG